MAFTLPDLPYPYDALAPYIRLGRPASNLHSTMRIGDPARGLKSRRTPIGTRSASNSLFAPRDMAKYD